MEEQALLTRLQSPDTRAEAFEQMVRDYQRMLYYHIRRMVGSHEDADDVLQNTFLKAWRYMEGFRGDSALRTWLYRIATNEALTFIQNRKKRYHQDLDGLENNPDFTQAPGGNLDGEEIRERLRQAILTLPERQRLVFNLRYFDEMKYEEIAELTGVSEGALKASFHHAVKKVEAFLQKER